MRRPVVALRERCARRLRGAGKKNESRAVKPVRERDERAEFRRATGGPCTTRTCRLRVLHAGAAHVRGPGVQADPGGAGRAQVSGGRSGRRGRAPARERGSCYWRRTSPSTTSTRGSPRGAGRARPRSRSCWRGGRRSRMCRRGSRGAGADGDGPGARHAGRPGASPRAGGPGASRPRGGGAARSRRRRGKAGAALVGPVRAPGDDRRGHPTEAGADAGAPATPGAVGRLGTGAGPRARCAARSLERRKLGKTSAPRTARTSAPRTARTSAPRTAKASAPRTARTNAGRRYVPREVRRQGWREVFAAPSSARTGGGARRPGGPGRARGARRPAEVARAARAAGRARRTG